MNVLMSALLSSALVLWAWVAAAPAPPPSVKLVSEGMKVVEFNAQTCRKAYVFTFKVAGSGRHSYRYVFSNGSSQGGGVIVLTPGREAALQKQVGFTLGSLKNRGGMDIWLGIAFDGGNETHMSTYHDTCQKP